MIRRVLSALSLVVLSGCGASGPVRLAQRGDLPALSKALDEQARKGALDDGTLRDVASAILEHDVPRLSGDEGERRLGALGACATPIRSTLLHTADGNGELSAQAALMLVQADLVAHDRFTGRHRDDPNPRWRAAATRGLTDASEAELRVTRARDDDRDVRRAAVEAAADAACATDFALLLEAARKDPDVVVRVSAVRGLASASEKLGEGSPRSDLVDRLGDLWNGAEDPVRGAIARAWAAPALFPAGGLGRLEETTGHVGGHVAVETASALMSAGGDGAALLATLAEDPEPAVKEHALRLLDPSMSTHFEALRKAIAPAAEGMPDDVQARLVASARVASYLPALAKKLGEPFEKLQVEAKKALIAMVAREDKLGTDAAIELAAMGLADGKARLVKDLELPGHVRFRAAGALVTIGQGAETRKLLSSTEIDVRDGAACAVLSARKP